MLPCCAAAMDQQDTSESVSEDADVPRDLGPAPTRVPDVNVSKPASQLAHTYPGCQRDYKLPGSLLSFSIPAVGN